MAEKIVQTAGKDSLGSFAPDFARYNSLGKYQLQSSRKKQVSHLT